MNVKALFPKGPTRIIGGFLAVNTAVNPKVRGQVFRMELFFNGDTSFKPVVVSYSDVLYNDSPVPGFSCSCLDWIKKPESSDARNFCEHLQLVTNAMKVSRPKKLAA